MMILKIIGAGLAGAALLAFVSFWAVDLFVRPTKAGISMLIGLVPAGLLAGFLLGAGLVTQSRTGFWTAAAIIYCLGAGIGLLDAWRFWGFGTHRTFRIDYEFETPANFDPTGYRFRAAGSPRTNTDKYLTSNPPGQVVRDSREMYYAADNYGLVVYREGDDASDIEFPVPYAGGPNGILPSASTAWTPWDERRHGVRVRFRWRIARAY
jgi:hypothetical protein